MVWRIDCGVNTDPLNPFGNPTAQGLASLGVTWVRFTFKDVAGGNYPASFSIYDPVVQSLRGAGLRILLILSYETLPNWPVWGTPQDTDAAWATYRGAFALRCRQIAQHYATHVEAYEIWNEPDHASGAYNPKVRAEMFGPLLHEAYGAIKAVSQSTVVMGGLAEGQSSYVRDVRAASGNVLYADALGVHPYFRRPTQGWSPPGQPPGVPWGAGLLTDLIHDYHAVAGKPIWVTEIGLDAPDETVRADYLSRSFEAIRTTQSAIAPKVLWYCWSNGMNPHFGLVGLSGERLAPYEAFRAFLSNMANAQARLEKSLLQEAAAQQCMQFNPNAALQKRIFEDGLVPNSAEFDFRFAGVDYVAQRAEHLGTGEVRVYYCQKGLWSLVWYVPRQPASASLVLDRPSAYHEDRAGLTVRYLLVLPTESPVGVAADEVLQGWREPNAGGKTAHELVLPGAVYRLVADDRAAPAIDSASAALPDGTSGIEVNRAIWVLAAYSIAGRVMSDAVRQASVERLAAACLRFGLEYTAVLGQGEVDGSGLPTIAGLAASTLRAEVADDLFKKSLLAAGEAHQAIQFNPSAALQAAIFGAGFVPNSPEFRLSFEGDRYAVQRAEHLRTGEVRVYYATEGQWQNVRFVRRP